MNRSTHGESVSTQLCPGRRAVRRDGRGGRGLYPIGVEAFPPVHDNEGATAHIGLTEGPGAAVLTFKVKDNPRL